MVRSFNIIRCLSAIMVFQNFIFLIFAIQGVNSKAGIVKRSTYSRDVIEDGNLDTAQLIAKYKFPVETQFITTKDNYILRIHRIPNPGRKPFLLQHGLADSSAGFIIMGPLYSLGYYLYNKGYDVWLGNARGNRYSRNHTILDPDNDEEFWNFSWHEIAVYDIPAIIDYILDVTHSDKLFYAGHSQGSTVIFVLCSLRPDYCEEKIILAHALAPVAFMKHIRSPLLPYTKNYIKLAKPAQELVPHSDMFKIMCLSGQQMEDVCANMFFLIMGRDTKEYDKASLPKIMGHIPAGISVKQLAHYIQLVKSDKFRHYDYGQNINQRIYNQTSPPDYDVGKIRIPIALHCGTNDFLSEIVDVQRLKGMLPNVVEMNILQPPQWNHVDFLYAKGARKILYRHMEELNKKFF